MWRAMLIVQQAKLYKMYQERKGRKLWVKKEAADAQWMKTSSMIRLSKYAK